MAHCGNTVKVFHDVPKSARLKKTNTLKGESSFLPPPKKTESQTWGDETEESPRTTPRSGGWQEG